MRGSFGGHVSLRFALLKTLTELGKEDELPYVGRVVTLYTCRFVGRRQYRKLIKEVIKDKDQVNRLADFKFDLDHSIYKNRLFKAVHSMSQYQRKTTQRYTQAAYNCMVQESDIRWCIGLLTKEELATLAKGWETITIYSSFGVQNLLHKLQAHIKSLARRHLTYVSKYDKSQDREDIVAELNLFAVYLIRLYEVKCHNEEHLLRTVNQGLTHQVANMSSAYGRPKRRPIERVHKRNTIRTVWWFNVKRMVVKKVKLDGVHSPRKVKSNGDLRVLVELQKSGKNLYVSLEDLYDTKSDAVEARNRMQETEASTHKRVLPIINLAGSDEDEYQLTNTSLDQPRGENGTKLLDLLPSDLKNHASEAFLYELSKHASERLARFAELVVSDIPDGLFVQWLRKRNRDFSSMGLDQVSREACRFLGCTIGDIREDLLETCSAVWSNPAMHQIRSEVQVLEAAHQFTPF